uniref:HEPN-associated N-terminal domain-containing protein n=1 Tax=Marinobacterium profundum TaxID=1714300 RepID=UPI0009EC304B
MENVCTRCVGDTPLKEWIRQYHGRRGCNFCHTAVAPTAPVSDLCEHIEQCICRYWGNPDDQMTYCSAEGGWVGVTYDTDELVFDHCELTLPLDHSGELEKAIRWCLSDDTWCDYDWLSLDEDQAMITSWDRFCDIVMHERRFFFQTHGADPEDRDSYSPISILTSIANFSESHGLVRDLEVGTRVYRARPDFKKRNPAASEFGPPPRHSCQNNRMNPAGVPMFYGALDSRTAVKEVGRQVSRVGYFQVSVPLCILDLTRLPGVPSYFSETERKRTMELSFMRHFSHNIMQPVDREDRAHVDYLPSQVVTEFLRDFEFRNGPLDGVLYGSVASPGKRNLVLFSENLTKPARKIYDPPIELLNFLKAKTVRIP